MHFVSNRLIGYIEEIEGSSDKYLVFSKNVRNKNINSVLDVIWGPIENKIEDIINPNIKIKDYDKFRFRFNSDIDLPLDATIEFLSLVINVSCVIEKDNEYYPEIYLNECLYVKSNVKTLFSKKYKYNKNLSLVRRTYKMKKVKELRIDSTLWATPARLVNLLDFEPEEISIETENNTNNNMKIHNIRYKNGGFYLTINNLRDYFNFNNNLGTLTMLFYDITQQNKYYQVWKYIFKIINRGHGELKLHEKIRLYDNDLPIKQVFKIHSITVVIKSLIAKNNKFCLELSINHCLYKL